MTPKRVIVSGSRLWHDEAAVRRALHKHMVWGDILVHGACRVWDKDLREWVPAGADWIADKLWYGRGPIERWPADRFYEAGTHGRYMARNQHMVDLGADACLAFATSWSSGTGQCARFARKASIPVFDYGVDTSTAARYLKNAD